MKIALLGYGKMGHMIEEIAGGRGHEVVLKIDAGNLSSLNADNLAKADAAIEFSVPSAALNNIELCFQAGTPVVVGTTGWYDKLEDVKQKCEAKDGALVYATNFSIGVNMLFSLNELLAKWMGRFPDYQVSIEEIHHTQKLDAPSGTAITLAEGVIQNIGRKTKWEKYPSGSQATEKDDVLPVYFDRVDHVPGVHTVAYTSEIDKITLHHEAFNRKGFALGAVLAAEFIKDKTGIYTAKDIFKFDIK